MNRCLHNAVPSSQIPARPKSALKGPKAKAKASSAVLQKKETLSSQTIQSDIVEPTTLMDDIVNAFSFVLETFPPMRLTFGMWRVC
jgi:hypothetical protein